MILSYLKNLGWTFLVIITLTFLLSIFSYFDLFSESAISIIKVIIPIISILVGSILTGMNANKKGYIEGLKFGVIYLLITNLFNLIIGNDFSYKNILFYLIILITSMTGSMVGINKKKN